MTDSSVSRVAASIESILETLNQVVSMQNEMQKLMASDRSMEKDNSDALEKFLIQQTFKHFLNEELPAIIEKTLKRELAMFVQTVEERFQKVVGNISSKLEAVVARQIQAQSQILQEALKLRLEASVVPEFEKSYSTMLELSIFMAERKYEEAFTTALMMEDVNIVSWLCAQVDLSTILWANCPPLSQVVLLNLLQNLACDISKETPRKLIWMRDVLSHIRRTDPTISELVRPIFEQVFRKLNHQHNLPTSGFSECASIRLIMHVIYSMLTNTISKNELYVHE